MARRSVIFWNLARLFGSAGSPIQQALSLNDASALATAQEVAAKISVIAATIDAIAATDGPPLLVGLAEIESTELAKRIAKSVTTVKLTAIDTTAKDETGLALDGLNISLLLDRRFFNGNIRLRSHVVDRTFDTRDILEADLGFTDGRPTVSVLVNHWPSRLSPEAEAQRIAAAHYVRRLFEDKVRFSLREMWNAGQARLEIPTRKKLLERARQPVIIMGDFNDEVFDDALAVLRSTPDCESVLDDLLIRGRRKSERFRSYVASTPQLFNPFWALVGKGSYYRSPRWRTYDQILLSRGVLEGAAKNPIAFVSDSMKVQNLRKVRLPDGNEFELTNRGGKPVKYDHKRRRGCSDHFPVSTIMEIADAS